MGVTRLDKIRNTHIKESLNLDQDVMDKVSTKRLKYFGHVLRIKPTRYQKITVEGNVTGNRPRGRPPKDGLDCISEDCKARSISRLTDASRLAADRNTWHTITIQNPSRGLLPSWTS
ncbi:uncharacterized protein LOC105444395 [Strongylocentrotus purpuratus]|uniref:Uncharacterized protein n=1 Tax=Strongylocentrotus purpuratus TaxID=7668 RepID=A0A7M7HQ35_STRPU|nr:uncharacterized protein LOC105444395 [Strongylocentrotus purpuratus]|eukprot:XP_011676900.1 PREDICTED: uncharacterized protein LOC105444395 [Strongylocentrotus purpuratus]